MRINATLLFVFMLSLSLLSTTFAQNNQWSSSDKFRNCMTSLQSTNDEQIRLNFALHYFLTEHSTILQLQDACYYLFSDQKKYELCVAAYPNILDKDNFFKIYDSFSAFSQAIKLYHNTQANDQYVRLQNDYQINVEEDNNTLFDLLIQKGDILLSNNQFDEAIAFYTQAQEIKPNDQVPGLKITEVHQIQTQLANVVQQEQQLNNQLNDFIQQGDVQLAANQVAQALALYEQAMQLQPGDPTAYQRIKEANNWERDLSNLVDAENQKQTEFNFLMQKGEILVSSSKFDQGIAAYQQASAIFPNNQTPFIKIDEANRSKLALANASAICSTNEVDFKRMKKSIMDATFSDKQAQLAKVYIQKKCFSIEQLKEIVKLFSMDDDKLEMIQYAYNYTYAAHRFSEFNSILTFSSTQKKLNQFLIDQQ